VTPFAFEVGDRCGYRAKKTESLVEVELLKIGQAQRNPQTLRVFIRWIDDEFEGHEQWVPALRLKVPWTDAAALMERERRWASLRCGMRGGPERSAASVVTMELPGLEDLLELQGGEDTGAAVIVDADGLARFLDVDPEFFDSDDSFVEDGRLVVGWPVTRRIVCRAVELNPGPIVAYLDRRDADSWRYQESMVGEIEWVKEECRFVRVPTPGARQILEEWRLRDRQLRIWCGVDAMKRDDEIQVLRGEVNRLRALAQGAVEELRRARRPMAANRLEQSLIRPRPTTAPSPATGRAT
jgi:hypothetical protein